MKCGIPILCEKPVSKDLSEVRQLCAGFALHGTRVQLVSQYEHCLGSSGPTYEDVPDESHWDYFRSGPDGLPWDCLQIIGLSNTTPSLGNKSPVWRCRINGEDLSLADMDQAYVKMIEQWIEEPRNDISRILDWHEKAAAWQKPF